MYRKVFLNNMSLALVATVLFLNVHGMVESADISQGLGNNYGNADEKVLCNATLEDDFADDVVLVVLNKKASTALDTSRSSVSLKSYNLTDFAEVKPISVNDLTIHTTEQLNEKLATIEPKNRGELGGSISASDFMVDVQKFNRILKLELEEKSKENVLDVIKQLEKRPDVLYAGPDNFFSIASTPPNGDYSSQQWALNNIELPSAWDITTGSSTVMVGVIDTGIQWNHPDLINRVPSSGVHRDFTMGSAAIIFNPTDLEGHGTHVAGIIGAEGKGVTGVCWNVSLISLRAFDSSGQGKSSYVVAAINYATAANIHILNLSAGWKASNPRYDVPLAVSINNYPGLFVCATGNDGSNNNVIPYYPSNYRLDNLISVGAIQNTFNNGYNERWGEGSSGGSNYGSQTVDIFAPGEAILSTYPTDYYMSNNSYHIAEGYLISSGTSQAAPYVTGVAALLLAKYPSYSARDLKRVIIQTGTTNSNLSGKCISGKQLNAYAALGSHVTVKNGYAITTGGGAYSSGSTVYLNAGTRVGYTFSHWTVNVGSVNLANSNSTTTTFSKPANSNVGVTANWTIDPYFDGYLLYDGEIYGPTVLNFPGEEVTTGSIFNVYASGATQIYLNGPWLLANGSTSVSATIPWWGDGVHWDIDIQSTWVSWGVAQVWVEY